MVKLKTIYDLEKINYNLNLINTTNYLKSNNDFQLPIINEEVFKYLILNNVKIGYTSIVLQIYEENNNFLIEKYVYNDYKTGKSIKNTSLTTYVSLNKLNNDNSWLTKALKLLTSVSISYSYELAGNDEILLNIVKLIENYLNKPMNLLILDDNVTCISYK